jgi:hypothetical protein
MAKKPNQELFRLLKFAISYPGWHSFDSSMTKHVRRGSTLGFLEISDTKQFRLRAPKHSDFSHDEVCEHNPLTAAPI